jgi:Methyltransferase domain
LLKRLWKRKGVSERVNVVAADVLSDPLAGSYDVAVMKGLLHVLSPQDARRALKHISAAVNPGGTIYIIGQILDDSRLSPLEAVGFNLTFINVFDAGESYTGKGVPRLVK